MSSQLAVRVESLSFEKDKSPLIDNFALDVEAGSFISLLGPSGSGKSTLLRVIAGLERRYIGSVVLNGKQIDRPSRDIQCVFQDARLFPWRSAEANLRFAACPSMPAKDVDKRITQYLDELQLTQIAHKWPKHLSGGQKTGLGVARAFMDPPEVLLLDEPFNGLDLGWRYSLLDLIAEAVTRRKTTVIMVSHSIEDAVFLSDKVYLLHKEGMRIAKQIAVDVPILERTHLDEALLATQQIVKQEILNLRSGGLLMS